MDIHGWVRGSMTLVIRTPSVAIQRVSWVGLVVVVDGATVFPNNKSNITTKYIVECVWPYWLWQHSAAAWGRFLGCCVGGGEIEEGQEEPSETSTEATTSFNQEIRTKRWSLQTFGEQRLLLLLLLLVGSLQASGRKLWLALDWLAGRQDSEGTK